MKLAHLTLSVVVLATSLPAQQTIITRDTPVSPALLHHWLHSGDPRLIAWSADFATRTHDTALLNDSRLTLADWSRNTANTWPYATLARIASMLLAKDSTPDFVSQILGASEEALEIQIVAKGTGFGSGGSGGSCADSGRTQPDPAWPPLYTYDLTEDGADPNAKPLVTIDNDRIEFRRYEANGPRGSCNFVRPLNPVTRHSLIAFWLGISAISMPWQPVEHATIEWTTQSDYLQQLGSILEAHRQTILGTVAALHRLGLLPESWSSAPPRLILIVHCAIDPCPLAK